MQIESALQQIADEPNVWRVQMTRMEVRGLLDDVDYDDLAHAADEAQGAADGPGKRAYIVIEVVGSVL